MNCGLCMAKLREKNRCLGCRVPDPEMPVSRARCQIRTCEILPLKGWRYCCDKCEKYPCRRLRDLDKRYRTKYHMSMIENLENIGELGIRAFVRNERARWACPACGEVICVHSGRCSACGKVV